MTALFPLSRTFLHSCIIRELGGEITQSDVLPFYCWRLRSTARQQGEVQLWPEPRPPSYSDYAASNYLDLLQYLPSSSSLSLLFQANDPFRQLSIQPTLYFKLSQTGFEFFFPHLHQYRFCPNLGPVGRTVHSPVWTRRRHCKNYCHGPLVASYCCLQQFLVICEGKLK